MKIIGNLEMALDFRDKKDVPHATASMLGSDGKWRVCKSGPKYSNTYLVTDYDDEGLAWLKAHATASSGS